MVDGTPQPTSSKNAQGKFSNYFSIFASKLEALCNFGNSSNDESQGSCNFARIIGLATNPPVVKTVRNESFYLCTLMTNSIFKGRDGQQREVPYAHRIKIPEHVYQQMTPIEKGDQVLATGEYRNNSFQSDNSNGEWVNIYELIADNAGVLSSKNKRQQSNVPSQNAAVNNMAPPSNVGHFGERPAEKIPF